jgi:predicted ATP-dependent serine protease
MAFPPRHLVRERSEDPRAHVVEVDRYLCANCSSPRPFLESRCAACGSRSSVYLAGIDVMEDPHAVAGDELARAPLVQIATGIVELDALLAGGVVVGATYLLYGAPGSRKTTLAGAIAQAFARARRRLSLYVSSEQPGAEARRAAERLAPAPNVAYLGIERRSQDWRTVRAEVERLAPPLVVYDSIQEFSAPLAAVVAWGKAAARTMGHTAIFVSQVNALGRPAGPRRTIHRCDDELELGPEGAWARLRKSRHVPTGTASLCWTPLRAPSGKGKAGKPKSARDGPNTSRM